MKYFHVFYINKRYTSNESLNFLDYFTVYNTELLVQLYLLSTQWRNSRNFTTNNSSLGLLLLPSTEQLGLRRPATTSAVRSLSSLGKSNSTRKLGLSLSRDKTWRQFHSIQRKISRYGYRSNVKNQKLFFFLNFITTNTCFIPNINTVD